MSDRSESSKPSPASPIANAGAESPHDSQETDLTLTPGGRPLRLVLMGTGPFAVPSFEALRSAGHEIAWVVTKPMPPVKSRKGPPASPVRLWAEEHSLEVFDPESINEDAAVERLKSARAQLLVVCDYGQILKPSALESADWGGINLHGSLLPQYRGAAPVQWALLSGDRTTGVSVIHMTPRLDGGPILVTKQTPIGNEETAGELEDRLAILGVDATLKAIEMLVSWDGKSSIGERQDPDRVTKAPRLNKSDADIDWGRTAREIDCHVRGMQPWPIAFTHFQVDPNKPPVRLAIKEIEVLAAPAADHHPGEIVTADGFLVASSDQMIEIKRLQPAGKREMTGSDFLRGHNPAPGSRLFSP